LLDQLTGVREVFGVKINDTLVTEWASNGRRQLVTEAELLPVLLARRQWQRILIGRKVIFFVDSEPAKFCLIRGTSHSPHCANLVRAILLTDASLLMWPWYTRVPSASNPADAPSRLDTVSACREFDAMCVVPEQPGSLLCGHWAPVA
jgi:hypothetical protein